MNFIEKKKIIEKIIEVGLIVLGLKFLIQSQWIWKISIPLLIFYLAWMIDIILVNFHGKEYKAGYRDGKNQLTKISGKVIKVLYSEELKISKVIIETGLKSKVILLKQDLRAKFSCDSNNSTTIIYDKRNQKVKKIILTTFLQD